MKQLIRKILKEEIENIDQIKKGVDIAVKILKQTYPFINGWFFDEDWNGNYTISIVTICDIKKVCEYFNSDLKDYYKNNYIDFYEDYPYPFSVLEISNNMDGDEKWKIWKEYNNTLNDLYELIPEDLKMPDRGRDYKKLDADRFTFK
jgi:hypothetical protein